MEQLAKKLVKWIGQQVSAAGCRGVVFGLSGGLDSSVVAALCKRACPDSTLAVIMPCDSDQTDTQHAREVADRFGIVTEAVALEETLDSVLRALPAGDYPPDAERLAKANIKPRLRMIVLYYLANRLNYLVAGTGNRSELSVGYFTKHGDGGADILPLGNLVKQQVRELAVHLDVPQPIIDKPPSGGLWPGQTDEGEMGITYAELDRYLTTGEANILARDRISNMITRSAHKRATPAIPPF